MPQLLSVNVGLPREVQWNGKTVFTAIWKTPVEGRRMARKLNLDGDAQGDREGHGGEQRAVYVYQIDSYRYWERVLGRNDFVYGQFGENFTIDGLSDDEVFIGDRYRIGGALFEVTQPRVTCYRVGLRMNEPRMASLLVAHHRPGFYLRVLQEGEVGVDDEITKIAEGPERMSVAVIDGLLYLPGHSRNQLQRAITIPALSEGWKQSFRAMLESESSSGSAGNVGLASEQAAVAWSGFRKMRIASIRRESENVSSFSMSPMDGQRTPTFESGQFIVLRLPVDRDQEPILRSYSLSSSPSADYLRISVKHEPQGVGSSFLNTRIAEGDVIEVSAPRGSFTLIERENPVVLLSAGVGVTPVLSMLHSLAEQRSKREIWWIYGARNGNQHPFAEESSALLRLLARGRRYVVYSRPSPTDQLGKDFDASGRIDINLLKKIGVSPSSDFYLCGPTSFMQNIREGLQTWGVGIANIHMELFGSLETVTPGIAAVQHTPHMPEGAPGAGPLISFVRSGITAPWDSKFATLLEMAEACDVPVRWSCRSGVCHTCMTGLISGSIRYDPDPLERPSAGNVLLCCSRPNENITLDA